eukprot:478706_1
MHRYMHLSLYENLNPQDEKTDALQSLFRILPKHPDQVVELLQQFQDVRDDTTKQYIKTNDNVNIVSCRYHVDNIGDKVITRLRINNTDFQAIGYVDWNDIMYSFNSGDWALFFLSIFKKYNISNVSSVSMSYKIQNIPSPDFASKCNKSAHALINLQHMIDKIVSVNDKFFMQLMMFPLQSLLSKLMNECNLKGIKSFFRCPIFFVTDFGFLKDSAVFFDTDPGIYWYLKRYANIILEDRKRCPAFTYIYRDDTRECRDRYVIDRNLNVYHSQNNYIKQRIRRAALACNKNYDEKELKYRIKYVMKWVNCSIPKDYFDTFMVMRMSDCIDLYEKYRKYVYPKRVRKLLRLYNMKIGEKFLRKCEICKKKESVRRKIYVCKCRMLFVCGRKCHKKAWSRKGHRDSCDNKR